MCCLIRVMILAKWNRVHNLVIFITSLLCLFFSVPLAVLPTFFILSIGLSGFILNPSSVKTFANLVTTCRFLLLLTATFLENPFIISLLLFCTLLMDGLDGWVARKLREESIFGAYFDMELDSLTLLLLSLLIIKQSPYQIYLFLIGAARPIMVIVKSIYWSHVNSERRSETGRIIFVQTFLVLLAEIVFNSWWSHVLCILAMIPLAHSFYLDCRYFERIKS